MAIQARTEFAAALNQIASEKGVDVSVVIDAIEQAALAAYRKDLSLRGEEVPEDFEEYTSKINPSSGEITIHHGDTDITPPGFARIAAQTAKQVIAQRLHEAEKGAIMDEYDKKVGTVISGTIQRQEGSTYYVDLGRAEGILPVSEQIRDEVYLPNQRLKFFIKEIRESGRGPEVIVSRADAGLVKGLFGMEVPEIQAGSVEIKEIAREAGGRTKLAAISTQEGVDPVGSLVGQKGVRVQAVINELGEEKIDIVPYSEDITRFIAAALSPAKDVIVRINEDEKVAKVIVPSSQLSLAIGKGGQNVRLAAKLTGYKIDIEGDEVVVKEVEVLADDNAESPIGAEALNEVAAVADASDVQTAEEAVQTTEQVIEGPASNAADAGEVTDEVVAEETSEVANENEAEIASEDDQEPSASTSNVADANEAEATDTETSPADEENSKENA